MQVIILCLRCIHFYYLQSLRKVLVVLLEVQVVVVLGVFDCDYLSVPLFALLDSFSCVQY